MVIDGGRVHFSKSALPNMKEREGKNALSAISSAYGKQSAKACIFAISRSKVGKQKAKSCTFHN
jgi:hypothetical protein